ncbi:lambda exonuclease family protein [Francisella tularensis]|uniref:lambda exonuclease family protein n=1 Tax=Francisella tularensis TaxID=263 RepID=UPI0008F46941|nr:lambda exonuclease family protein [Francisella tularensis]APA83268.1 hypothetical protein N894_1284 [Francisella tularensis subsp. novicida PA10-7858]
MFDFNESDFKSKPKYTMHFLEQNTPEWHSVRAGKFTASNINILLGNGSTRDNIILTKAAEVITGRVSESKLNTKDIQRGRELESDAKIAYSNQYGIDVEDVGFCELDPFTGVSPDCFAGDDGMAEFKCPNDANFLKIVAGGYQEISSLYMYQMQMQMWVCEKSWCDFVIFNPNFEKSSFKIRVYPDEKYVKNIKEAIERARKELKQYIKNFRKNINGDIYYEQSTSNVA